MFNDILGKNKKKEAKEAVESIIESFNNIKIEEYDDILAYMYPKFKDIWDFDNEKLSDFVIRVVEAALEYEKYIRAELEFKKVD